jgi:hypothetical protein
MDCSFAASRLSFLSRSFGLSPLSLFLLSLFFIFSCATEVRAEQGWIIDQDDRVCGPRIVYLSKRGIRIESKSNHSVVVSQPPSWNVVSFSDQTKKYFECPADKYVNVLSQPIAAIWGMNLAMLPLKVGSPVTKCGVAATNYESSVAYDEKFWKRDLKDKNSRRLPLSASAIYTDALNMPAPESAVLTRLSNIPAPGGVPLMFMYKDQDRDVHLEVRTFSIKSADLSKILFQQPANYKRVSKPGDALRAVENDDELRNLF